MCSCLYVCNLCEYPRINATLRRCVCTYCFVAVQIELISTTKVIRVKDSSFCLISGERSLYDLDWSIQFSYFWPYRLKRSFCKAVCFKHLNCLGDHGSIHLNEYHSASGHFKIKSKTETNHDANARKKN